MTHLNRTSGGACIEPAKILLLEDDPGTADVLRTALGTAGFETTWYEDPRDCLNFFRPGDYKVAILDRRLPGTIDGLDVCRELRAADPGLAILFLSVVAEELERILGLEIGADDYLAKPFSARELIARIRAVLRRSSQPQVEVASAAHLEYGSLSINTELRKVTVYGHEVRLTATEFNLLAFLAQHPGRAFTRAQVIRQVWGYSGEGYEDSVTVLVQRLRTALEADPKSPKFILTVRGIGYRFCELSSLS